MWLAIGTEYRDGDAVEQALPGLAALEGFAHELRGRFDAERIDGTTGLVHLHRRLQATLVGISDTELARALETTQALVRSLEAMGRCLEELKRVKRLLGA